MFVHAFLVRQISACSLQCILGHLELFIHLTVFFSEPVQWGIPPSLSEGSTGTATSNFDSRSTSMESPSTSLSNTCLVEWNLHPDKEGAGSASKKKLNSAAE